MGSFFPRSIEEFINWFRTFVTVAAANLVTLKIDQTLIDEWNVKLDALIAAQNTVDLTKSAAREAVVDKDNKWNILIDIASEYNGIFQSDKKVPQEVIEALGLHRHDTTPSHEVPFPPTDVKVIGSPKGIHKIYWSKNGNKPGTQYIIEVKYALDGAFQNVDTITATRYDHQNQKPGVPAWYRITPRRGKLLGDPSETVGVYT